MLVRKIHTMELCKTAEWVLPANFNLIVVKHLHELDFDYKRRI
jgi:hypothetical protein